MATIVNKIKQSVQSSTGLACLYGSLDDINVQMEDQTNFPVAFFVLLNNGNLNDTGQNYRERVDVAVFFVQPTEFDFNSIENESLIENCKDYATLWLNSLFLDGELRYISTLNTSRVYNQTDTILTGFAVRVRLEEMMGNTMCPEYCNVFVYDVPSNSCNTTGQGKYTKNSTVTLTAMPKHGYNFVKWRLEGEDVSESSVYSFEITEDVNAAAVLEPIEYTVTAEAVGGGSVSGAGKYYYGQTCRLKAIPDSGYELVHWMINGKEVSTDDSYSFTVTDDVTVSAVFDVEVLTVTTAAEGNGTATGGGRFLYGETCTLTASPDTGYELVHWIVNGREVSTDEEYSFTVYENVTVTAVFQIKTCTVSIEKIGFGTITGAGTYTYGQTCVLEETPDTGYNFSNWSVDGHVVSVDSTYSFTVEDDVTVTALFEIERMTVSTSVSGHGTTTGAGTYDYGQTCTLTATPETGYDFVRWTIGGEEISTNPSYSFTVTEDVSITAVFIIQTFTVTVNSNTGGSATSGGTYDYGQTCTLTATPETGYHFVNWTVLGQEVSTSTTYSFTVTEDVSVYAVFEIDTFTITTSVYGSGTVTGAGTYEYGQTCTVTIVPDAHYTFLYWEIDGSTVSSSTTYSFTVTEDVSLTAVLDVDTYTVTVTYGTGGTATGGGTYGYGSTATVTATPDTHYSFSHWEIDGVSVSTNAVYSFTVEDDVTLDAVFEVRSYNVTVVVGDHGTATGGGTFQYGQTCTVTATADIGYDFIGWYVGGSVVSTSATYSFTVEDDVTITAEFVELFTVTVTYGTGGTATGGGTYRSGATCTVTATRENGYRFVDWTVGGTEVSADNPYSFTVTSDVTINAEFYKPSPLKFTAEQDDVHVSIHANNISKPSLSLKYSKDGIYWYNYNFGSTSIVLNRNEYVMFKGDNITINDRTNYPNNRYYSFYLSGKAGASGEVISLIDSTMGNLAVPDYGFAGLFRWCQNLTSPPSLPSTALGEYCYRDMFNGCTYLRFAPSLPATTLSVGCYMNMFNYCSYIRSIDLPATTLATDCYNAMFYTGVRLEWVSVRFTDWGQNNRQYTRGWLHDVADTGTFRCPRALPIRYDSLNGDNIPPNWTVSYID